MKNNKVVILLALLCGLLVGFGIYHFLMPKKVKTETEIVTVYDDSKEQAIIDSCNVLIAEKEREIAELKEAAENIKVVVIKEVEKIKEAPIDENVELMKENLLAYGELTQETDTLPSTIILPTTDTLVALSPENVKDVNIIAAKYKGEEEINYKLEEALFDSEFIIAQKDSIILQNNYIIENQNTVYSEGLEILGKSLEKEKKKRTVWTAILGGVAAALSIICIAK